MKAALEAQQPDTDAAIWCAPLLAELIRGARYLALLHTTACRISRTIGLCYRENASQGPLVSFCFVCQPRIMELEG